MGEFWTDLGAFWGGFVLVVARFAGGGVGSGRGTGVFHRIGVGKNGRARRGLPGSCELLEFLLRAREFVGGSSEAGVATLLQIRRQRGGVVALSTRRNCLIASVIAAPVAVSFSGHTPSTSMRQFASYAIHVTTRSGPIDAA